MVPMSVNDITYFSSGQNCQSQTLASSASQNTLLEPFLSPLLPSLRIQLIIGSYLASCHTFMDLLIPCLLAHDSLNSAIKVLFQIHRVDEVTCQFKSPPLASSFCTQKKIEIFPIVNTVPQRWPLCQHLCPCALQLTLHLLLSIYSGCFLSFQKPRIAKNMLQTCYFQPQKIIFYCTLLSSFSIHVIFPTEDRPMSVQFSCVIFIQDTYHHINPIIKSLGY